MTSAIQRRKAGDPIKEVLSKVADCRKERNRAKRELDRLDQKLDTLLDSLPEHIKRMVE